MFVKNKSLQLTYNLPIFLGTDAQGKKHYANLVDLKHILMAGMTGSGKSNFGHTIINSLISILASEKLKFILIDMKRVEFTKYIVSPYLLTKILVSNNDVMNQLGLLIIEQKNRSEKMQSKKVKSIEEYNKLCSQNSLPYIIVLIDTFSDIICNEKQGFEKIIFTLTDRSVNVGIHIVMWDSRLGSDIFTHTILASFPTKICFNVCSAEDSKLIINTTGGEKLNGHGDMLLLKEGQRFPIRLQAPLIAD